MIKILDETTVNSIAAEGPLTITEIAAIVSASQSEVHLALKRAFRKLARQPELRRLLNECAADHVPCEIKTVNKIRISVK